MKFIFGLENILFLGFFIFVTQLSSRLNQFNSDLKPLIMTKKFVFDNQTIDANSNKTFILKDTIINDYNRLNNRINLENATSNGTLSSLCNCYNIKANGNDTQVIIRNNHAANQAKILIEITIIYIKSSFAQDL